ncbi:MAG: DsrE family protein [Acidobacteria bacterium]|nr:DsrE family protein [Acidobacteriota bacterium]
MEDPQKMVLVISRGFDDERSSVAWSITNAAVASGFDVTVFLVAAGVDWARRGAAEVARPNPLDPPIGDMIRNVRESGGRILACPPCAKVRGYTPDDLMEGVEIAGAPAMLEVVKQGASTLSF